MYIETGEEEEVQEEMKVFQYVQKYWRIGSLDLKVQVLLQKSQTYFKVPERHLPRYLSILSLLFLHPYPQPYLVFSFKLLGAWLWVC